MVDSTRQIGIFESLCAGYHNDLLDGLPLNFLEEGALMLRAIQSSLRLSAGFTPFCFVHESHAATVPSSLNDVRLAAANKDDLIDEVLQFARSQSLHQIIVIAPECNGELLKIVKKFKTEGVHVWNCSAPFIQLCSDKWELANYLRSASLRHPKTFLLSELLSTNNREGLVGRVVLKPRDGAGCLDVKVFETANDMFSSVHREEKLYEFPEGWIVQEWIEGIHASRSVVFGVNGRELCPWVTQELVFETATADPHIKSPHYTGARPIPNLDLALAQEYFEHFERNFGDDLCGWVGFDFVVSLDGNQNPTATLIEINPRFTTSFEMLQASGSQSLLARFL